MIEQLSPNMRVIRYSPGSRKWYKKRHSRFPHVTRRLMDREGFLLYKFESAEVHKANQQCVFKRSSARELKTYRLVR